MLIEMTGTYVFVETSVIHFKSLQGWKYWLCYCFVQRSKVVLLLVSMYN